MLRLRALRARFFTLAAVAAEEDALASITDLSFPASWYPSARALERTVIAHLGPTNSGKTHHALEALAAAPSGTYCGPLRLLAWEVAERLNTSNVPCSLVTGQEVRDVPGARHTSCTVEMASTIRSVDVAVVDEVQLVGDHSRGWAFTRALLGIPAAELHVCGDPAALPLIQKVCSEAGERLEVRHYERLSPLRFSRRPLESLSEVRRGDAVVAFSRREVHAVRRQIEADTGMSCALVYGALPPEARTQQAQLFNAPRNGVQILAGTDCIGMGLNLAIKRIIFKSLNKYDGFKERGLTAAEVKQIAGRAGRHLMPGAVTTMTPEDMPMLEEAMRTPSDPVLSAALFPRFSQLSAFAGSFPAEGLPGILDRFAAQASMDSHYFLARFEELRTNAVMLRHLPLTLRESWVFAMSPCDPEDDICAVSLLNFATVFAQRRRVTPVAIQHPILMQASSVEELQQLEAVHRVYDLYIWLSYRFEEFEGREVADERRNMCGAPINASLRDLGGKGTERKGRTAG